MIVKELFAKLGFEFDEAAFARADHALGSLSKGLATVAGIAAGVAGAFTYEISKLTDLGVEVSRTAQKVGVTTDALQQLRFAADLSGVDAETLNTGLRRLSRTIYEASVGSEDAAYSLHQVGVSARDAHGQLKPTDQILEQVADRFNKMPDGIQKTALAQKVFGRGGAALIPLLNKGRAGIDELRVAAEQYGVVLGKDTIAASLEAEESTKRFEASLKGLKNTMLGPLIGGFNKIRDAMTDWVLKHRQIIATGFLNFVKGLAVAGKVVLAVFRAIYNAFALIYDVGGIPAVILAVVALDAAFGSLGLAAVAAGVKSAIAWTLAALPIIGIVAAIALVLLALDDFKTYMEGGDSVIGRVIKGWHDKFGSFGDGVKEIFSNLGNWILDWAEKVGQQFANSKLGKFLTFDFAVEGIGKISDFISDQHRIGAALNGGNDTTGFAPSAGEAPNGIGPRLPGGAFLSPVGRGGGASVQIHNENHVEVNGANADPNEIAGAIRKHLDDHDAENRRKTAAATGGASATW